MGKSISRQASVGRFEFLWAKAVVSLAMTNALAEPVESARAICFLLDEQGKVSDISATLLTEQQGRFRSCHSDRLRRL
jgi:hypothetical protein